MAGRSERRRHWAHDIRIDALEGDVDELEADVKNDMRDLRDALRRQTALLVGMLISLSTAAVLLALDLGARGGP